MKKLMLFLAVLGFLVFANVNTVKAQNEDPLEIQDDTLSIDEMDPVFYEGEEESGSSTTTIAIVVVAIVVLGGAIYYYIRKKKK